MELTTFRLRLQPHPRSPKAEGLLEKEDPVASLKLTTPSQRQCSQHLPRVPPDIALHRLLLDVPCPLGFGACLLLLFISRDGGALSSTVGAKNNDPSLWGGLGWSQGLAWSQRLRVMANLRLGLERG